MVDLTTTQRDAVESAVVRSIYLVELTMVKDGVTVMTRATSAPFPVHFDSDGDGDMEEFPGVGDLGSLSPIHDGYDIGERSITVTLHGLQAETVSEALLYRAQNQPAKVWEAFLNEDHQIIDFPVLLFSGVTDQMPIEIGADGEATISVVISNRAQYERLEVAYYSNESQRRLWPDDTGFRAAGVSASKEIIWGRG